MLTPRQAWRRECRWCSNCTPDNCNTVACKLSTVFDFTSTLQRIKAHCIDCNGEDHPKECDGHIIRENHNEDRWYYQDEKRESGVCFLRPFRLGKNPKRKKTPPSPEKLLSMAEVFKKRMEKYRLRCKNPAQDRLSYAG